jgi:hypothetical protein
MTHDIAGIADASLGFSAVPASHIPMGHHLVIADA